MATLPFFPEPPRPSPPELIVIARPGVEFHELASAGPLKAALERAGAALRPLFGEREAESRAAGRAAVEFAGGDAGALHLESFHAIDATGAELEALAACAREDPGVEAAYVKPGVVPAVVIPEGLVPGPRPSGPTRDFSPKQGYLDPAPGGVDARHAWRQQGGTGAGVRIIDVEGGWNSTHEDLLAAAGGLVHGQINPIRWQSHGTAVMGILGADHNGIGVMGICPGAVTSGASVFPNGVGRGSAPAIRAAADRLGRGDVLLIELHRAGPAAGFQQDPNQYGMIPVEWWPDDFEAIRYATLRGVIVVSVAGNGEQDLADPIYDTPPAPAGTFPPRWRNPFRRNPVDSGSILVGAGAPPGADAGDLSRLGFSNYGPPVDAQGWGIQVTTTGGIPNLQRSPDGTRDYTDSFGGTSAAAPMVAGALACVQGVLRAAGRQPLTPAAARALLRETGSAQQDGEWGKITERIGSRPDIRQMLERVVGTM